MKCFLLLALAALIAAASCADCNMKGHEFNKGEKYAPSGECKEFTCNGVNELSALTCPEVWALKPCKYIPMDRSKPWPKCCAQYDCTKH